MKVKTLKFIGLEKFGDVYKALYNDGSRLIVSKSDAIKLCHRFDVTLLSLID